MKPNDKCEICGETLDDSNRETITYRGAVIYVCGKCMHRIISYMTILAGYVELCKQGKEVPDIVDQMDELKKLLKKQGKRFKRTIKK